MQSSEMFDGGEKILHDVPEAQNALLENHRSLLKVSEYCYQNYIQSGNRSALALEETKKLTYQSLASVAYQINSLASRVLSQLDTQANQLLHLESSINLIGQISGRPAKQSGTIRTLGSTLRTSRSSEVPLYGSLAPAEPPEPAAASSFRIGKQVEPPTVPHLTSPSSAPGSSPSHPLHSPGGVEALPLPPDRPAEAEVLPPPPDPPAEAEVPPPPPDPPAEAEVLPPPPDPPADVEVLPPPPDPPAEAEVLPPEPDTSLPVDPHPQNAEAPAPPSNLPVAVPASPHLAHPPAAAEASPLPPECLEAASPGAVKVPTVASTTRGRPPRRSALSTLSLRLPSGSGRHRCQTRSLFLPSFIIPPPPPYPAPSVPSQPPPPPPRFCLPARLDHLDLEILTPPPCLLLDNEGGCDDMTPPPSDQPKQTPQSSQVQ
ncbi:uncharacterized protein LOC128750941 isoform X3 [Synchiropus splendidus]|uniref:uncharacterized protein LOC128750941 isoform X3 n=1 Tax=Synchiropus splendidus TaxID=270530 RepID=UPI00237E8728|nr:uncharacterized protein LOC128750941 isoform X3 [Synchiropus splendidus]